MRKLMDLQPEEFPSVNPEKFTEWKQAKSNAMRNYAIALIVLAALYGIATFVFNVSGFIPLILMLVGIGVLNFAVNGKANRLQKELGIDWVDIKAALREE